MSKHYDICCKNCSIGCGKWQIILEDVMQLHLATLKHAVMGKAGRLMTQNLVDDQ